MHLESSENFNLKVGHSDLLMFFYSFIKISSVLLAKNYQTLSVDATWVLGYLGLEASNTSDRLYNLSEEQFKALGPLVIFQDEN